MLVIVKTRHLHKDISFKLLGSLIFQVSFAPFLTPSVSHSDRSTSVSRRSIIIIMIMIMIIIIDSR